MPPLSDIQALASLIVSDGREISLDIAGFSRGAAMGRDFANRVASRLQEQVWGAKTECVALRFMGLWDTVAQFGLNGAANTEWQLAIPPQAQQVFQAVALNESRYLFPGESIRFGVQRGFVGDHADTGGSYGSGDLSNVALNWMVEQARQSGVELYTWGKGLTDESWGKVTEPLFHQKANTNEHSQFCERDNNARSKNCVSRDQWQGGGLSAELGLGFVNPLATPELDADGNSLITGSVDMTAYLQGPRAHGHKLSLLQIT